MSGPTPPQLCFRLILGISYESQSQFYRRVEIPPSRFRNADTNNKISTIVAIKCDIPPSGTHLGLQGQEVTVAPALSLFPDPRFENGIKKAVGSYSQTAGGEKLYSILIFFVMSDTRSYFCATYLQELRQSLELLAWESQELHNLVDKLRAFFRTFFHFFIHITNWTSVVGLS